MTAPAVLGFRLRWRAAPPAGRHTCVLSATEFEVPQGAECWLYCARTDQPVDLMGLTARFPEQGWGGELPPEARRRRCNLGHFVEVALDTPDAAQLLAVRWMTAHRQRPDAYSAGERARATEGLVAHLGLVAAAFVEEPVLLTDLVAYLDEAEARRASPGLTLEVLRPHRAVWAIHAPHLHERLRALETVECLERDLSQPLPAGPPRFRL